jgi:hypothetical protein
VFVRLKLDDRVVTTLECTIEHNDNLYLAHVNTPLETNTRKGYAKMTIAITLWCAKRAGLKSSSAIAMNTSATGRPKSAMLFNKLGFRLIGMAQNYNSNTNNNTTEIRGLTLGSMDAVIRGINNRRSM